MDANEVLSSLGQCGPWHVLHVSLVLLTGGVVSAFHMLNIVFIGADTVHHCTLPENKTLNESVPWVHDAKGWELDSCKVYVNFSATSNQTTRCPDGWSYDTSQRDTIVNEWDLVCDQGYLVALAQTIQLVGLNVGSVVCTIMADRFGRKKMFVVFNGVIGVLGIVAAFAPAYWMFVVLRFFIGIVHQGILVVRLVLACEMFPPSHRADAALIGLIIWPVGICLLSPLAYLLRQWRHLMLAISIPEILCVGLYWVLPESIPWLISMGRTQEARIVTQKAALCNKVCLPEHLLSNDDDNIIITKLNNKTKDEHQNNVNFFRRGITALLRICLPTPEEKSGHQYSLLDIFRSSKLRPCCMILCYIWFGNNLTYYSLSLNVGSLAGDLYVNFFLQGLCEIPTLLLAIFLLRYFGRRTVYFAYHITCGAMLLLMVTISETLGSNPVKGPLVLTLALVGRAFIASAFSCIILFGAEIYPTTVRTAGTGFAALLGRIGGMIAPFSAYLAQTVPWCPPVVTGIMTIGSGFLILLLPETRGRPLPQTIEEVENWSKRPRKESKVAVSGVDDVYSEG